MMPVFQIAHISDLHFSEGAAEDGTHSHSIRHLEGIESVVKHRELDRLIVSGDLSNRGDVESLLRAREWLYKDFGIGGDRRVGLNMAPDRIKVIPGNHDAYNARHSKGSALDCWQKSLENYNKVFADQPFGPDCQVGYDWIEKDGFGVFVALVDTCYLNDPAIERSSDIADACITAISKPARGRISRRQSNRLLDMFDSGMRGQLSLPDQTGCVAKDKFAKSLKIVVMHHYIFEPVGCAEDVFLKIADRDRVLRNIAMADFDVLLCGHKHFTDFSIRPYGKHFDKRAKGRYCLNLFRRMLGIHTLPLAFEAEEGRRLSRAMTLLMQVLYLDLKQKESQSSLDHEQCTNALIAILQDALDNPAKLEGQLKSFIKTHNLQGECLISDDEIVHIERRISAELTLEQRRKLKGLAKQLQSELKRLSSRPFLQIMAGSACKNPEGKDKARGFNIYNIDASEKGYTIHAEHYSWRPGEASFCDLPTRREHSVEGFQRIMFPDVSTVIT